ncbi:MAG: hypothetical protein VZR73_14430, partial [Acutalibacteraceae bacterium]|nr:hypothetical protein [Acutalibacteraceae bacterium]
APLTSKPIFANRAVCITNCIACYSSDARSAVIVGYSVFSEKRIHLLPLFSGKRQSGECFSVRDFAYLRENQIHWDSSQEEQPAIPSWGF